MARRTYELVFNEDTPERGYDNRLGFEYTDGRETATLVHPDSQNSAQHVELTEAQLDLLYDWVYDIRTLIAKAKNARETAEALARAAADPDHA